jgi:hypothetical protein
MIEEKTVIIAGIGKNGTSNLNNYIHCAKQLGDHFKDYHILICLKDPIEDFNQVLEDLGEEIPTVNILRGNCPPDDHICSIHAYNLEYKPCELEINGIMRNQVLDHLYANGYDNFDYFVSIDVNFTGQWPYESIKESIELDQEYDWDAVFANIFDRNGRVSDPYSFRDARFPFGAEVLGEYWQKSVCPKLKASGLVTKNLIPVYSAFNGLGIYKIESIKNCKYSGVVTKDYEDYVKFIIKNNPRNRYVKWYLKSRKIFLYYGSLIAMYLNEKPDKDTDILFRCNNGYNYPVISEYVPFHTSMIMKGKNRIYNNPCLEIEHT